MVRELYVNILTPRRLLWKADGRAILETLCHVYPDLTPERYGDVEPLRSRLDASRPEEVLDAWPMDFFWKRRQPKVEGAALPSQYAGDRHGWISLSIDAANADAAKLLQFVQKASVRLDADFGCLHLLTESDVPIGRASHTVGCLDPKREIYSLSVTGHHLLKCLPDLYWTTVFGPAYVRHFGLDHILASPAPIGRRLAEDSVFLQLSESPFDLETDFARVDEVRQAVKRHLDRDSFFDPDASSDHVYSVPEFRLEPLEAFQ